MCYRTFGFHMLFSLLAKAFSYAVLQIVQDNEVGALKEALDGRYIEPGPGGDPIRNPAVLPTGKNIHALDPQSIPTQVQQLFNLCDC